MMLLLFVCAALASPKSGRNLLEHKTDTFPSCFVCRVVLRRMRELAPDAALVQQTLGTQVCSKGFNWMKDQV
jgi:hypothetical protein